MTKGLAVATIMFVACAYSSAAIAIPVRCDTCRDDGAFREEAVAAGPGTHLVYNLETGVVQQWSVGGEKGGSRPAIGRPRGAPKVTAQTPSPGATIEARRAHELYVQGGGTIRPIIVVPISRLQVNPNIQHKTAYDFVNDRNMQGQVETAAGIPEVISAIASTGLVTALADLTNLASSYLGLKNMACLLLKVVYKDGSYTIIRVDLDHANGSYEPNSARTQGGQLVPENIDQVAGEWSNYAGEDLKPMLEQVRRLGATVTSVGSNGHGRIQTISCSGAGAGKVCAVRWETY